MKTLNLEDCAAFLKIDPSTAQKLAARGELPGAKIGRAWVFLEDDLVAYLRSKVHAQMSERKIATTPTKAVYVGSPKRRSQRKRPLPDLSQYGPIDKGQEK